jgi:YHS domain-containing protein
VLRVLLIGILFWIIARTFWRMIDGVVEGVTGKRPRGRSSAGPKPTKLVRDPVCGTFVVPDAALALTRGNTVYHFCSAGCRAKFTDR